MTYTEEEAKKKWCHRAPTGLLGHPHAMCIGSGCMAWRAEIQWRPRSDYNWAKGKAESSGPNVQERVVGYCGLAGTPQ